MFKPIIRIDDRSPNVDYVGEWTPVDGTQYDKFVKNGKPFRSTLRQLKSTGSFGHTFYGQFGKVVGTNIDIEGALKPSWTCALDSIPILLPPNPSNATNNSVFCEWSALLGWHTLTFNVTFDAADAADTQPFLFDYIAYDTVLVNAIPGRSISTRFGNSISYLPSLSEEWIFFDESWILVPPTGKKSGSGGSKMTFDFLGMGLEVLGSVPPNKDGRLAATTVTYSIDGEENSFSVPSTSAGMDIYQFFNVSSLSSAGHTLTITYSGNETTVPLIIQEIIVYPSDPLPIIPSPVSQQDFIGGVVGGTVALAFVGYVVASFVRLRRSRVKLSNPTDAAFPLVRRFSPSSRRTTTSPETISSHNAEPPTHAPLNHPLHDRPSPDYDPRTNAATHTTGLVLDQPPVYSPT